MLLSRRALALARPLVAPVALAPMVARRTMATAASAAGALATYPQSLKALHWAVALGFGGSWATVQWSRNSSDKTTKGTAMMIHKSIGVSLLALVSLRVGARLAASAGGKIPGPVTGAPKWQHLAADASHGLLYALMIFMPVSGVAMGYFGGKGIPFFGLGTIPGAETPNGTIAKNAFQYHKLVGSALPYIVAAHFGGAVLHSFQGHTIWLRINPFV